MKLSQNARSTADEKPQLLPKLTDEDPCKSPADLFVSDKFKQFLRTYNRRTKQRVTVDDILTDYETAKRVYDHYEKCLWTRTPAGVSAKVQSLVEEILEEIKDRDRERVLPEHEIVDRFDKLGIDIWTQRLEMEKFYGESGFWEAMRQQGVLSQGKQYKLPLPKLTEVDMLVIETAFADLQADCIFIDDARLPLSTNLKIFAPNAARRYKKITSEIDQAVPFDEIDFASLKEQIEGSEDKCPRRADVRFARGVIEPSYSKDEVREVRFVVYKSGNALEHRSPLNQTRLANFTDNALNDYYGMLPLDLGTYLRLSRYLDQHRQIDADYLNTGYTEDDRGRNTESFSATTVLNNVFPDGKVLTVQEEDLDGKSIKLKKMDPTYRQEWNVTKRALFV